MILNISGGDSGGVDLGGKEVVDNGDIGGGEEVVISCGNFVFLRGERKGEDSFFGGFLEDNIGFVFWWYLWGTILRNLQKRSLISFIVLELQN